MSSLQHRIREGASKPTKKAPTTPQNHGFNSFESCFSGGLDLTEFASSGSSSMPIAASAELAQRKMDAAERRHREDKEEAALERRVAEVADLAKNAPCSSETLGSVVPRAMNPNNASREEAMGSGRNDNFIQFQDSAVGNNGFLSSLVSNHKSEGKQGIISHKSRALLKNKNQLKKQQLKSGGSSRGISTIRRQAKQHSGTSAGRKVTKKSRKSKF